MPAADPGPSSAPGAARRVAAGGIAVALCLILLAAVRLSPTADLAFLALCSLCVAAVVVEAGMRTAAVAWAAASVLSLLFPGPAVALGFVGFFGPYPLLKAFVEGRPGLPKAAAWGLKFLCFEILLAAGGFLALGPLADLLGGAALVAAWQEKLGGGADVPLVVALLAVAAQAVFLAYDLALTALISFYLRRVRPAIRR